MTLCSSGAVLLAYNQPPTPNKTKRNRTINLIVPLGLQLHGEAKSKAERSFIHPPHNTTQQNVNSPPVFVVLFHLLTYLACHRGTADNYHRYHCAVIHNPQELGGKYLHRFRGLGDGLVAKVWGEQNVEQVGNHQQHQLYWERGVKKWVRRTRDKSMHFRITESLQFHSVHSLETIGRSWTSQRCSTGNDECWRICKPIPVDWRPQPH